MSKDPAGLDDVPVLARFDLPAAVQRAVIAYLGLEGVVSAGLAIVGIIRPIPALLIASLAGLAQGGYIAFRLLTRVATVLELTPGELRWRTHTRSGHIPLTELRRIRRPRLWRPRLPPRYLVADIEASDGVRIIAPVVGGFEEFAAALTEHAPALDCDLRWQRAVIPPMDRTS
jgi:hypothetical protein